MPRRGKKAVPINSDALRLFCQEHGGVKHVAAQMGTTMNTIYRAIRDGKLGGTMLETVCAAYSVPSETFTAPREQTIEDPSGPERFMLTYRPGKEEPERSVVDELIEEMEAVHTQPAPEQKQELIKELRLHPVGAWQPKQPKSWRNKTLAEMTGEDISKMIYNVLNDFLTDAIDPRRVTLRVGLEPTERKSKYGW